MSFTSKRLASSKPRKPLLAARYKRPPRTEFACLVGHEALEQGELQELTYGFWYLGTDDRGLPLYCCEESITPDGENAIQFYPILDNYWRGANPPHKK
jgi:hypothetical protein